MKKTIMFLAAVFMTIVSVAPVFADGNGDGASKSDQNIIIIRLGTQKNSEKRHHAPARIPMEVSYVSFMSALKITFLNDLGSMDVNVTNHTTGEYISGTMNAAAGVTMLPISGTEGFYTITFTLPGGREYTGDFEL
ncbi:MAG: DUF3244 domain-containing protein [Bacteroidales bacterium]|nr:DUF3244 domain-containing protein [Bacteroidales bacterium]